MFLLTYLFHYVRLRFALCLMFFFLATGLCGTANAQTHASMWRSSLNSSYATLVGGDGNGSPLGNYASLEPLGGSVSFKGTLALGDIKKNRLSFLSIAAQGELVDGNLVSAFKNTKLNTSAGVSIEYNFRLSRDKAVTFGSAEARYKVDNELIVAGETAAVNAYSAELAAVAAKLKAVKAQKTMVQNQIQLREQQLVVLDGLIGDAANSFKVRDDAYNEAQKLIAELPKMRKSVDVAQFQLDSLGILAKADNGDLNTHFQRQQRELADGKNAKLQASFAMAEYRFLWVSLIAGAGKKDYYTFDGTKLFPDQLANPNLPTYRLGFALNYYFQDNLTKNAWMLNIGGQVMTITSGCFPPRRSSRNRCSRTLRAI
ncbi:hypothetical protein [uncultured Pedobacter sp.]|uniref:hypothetical protein n=1 Tax=uncultured Pedobacter sp. TaxID=246139 RepID=UPI00261C8955|nr:hypothetical protein [uncultured Pedobacter sp.]